MEKMIEAVCIIQRGSDLLIMECSYPDDSTDPMDDLNFYFDEKVPPTIEDSICHKKNFFNSSTEYWDLLEFTPKENI